eukprot:511062-Prymnesium_polylepis.1
MNARDVENSRSPSASLWPVGRAAGGGRGQLAVHGSSSSAAAANSLSTQHVGVPLPRALLRLLCTVRLRPVPRSALRIIQPAMAGFLHESGKKASEISRDDVLPPIVLYDVSPPVDPVLHAKWIALARGCQECTALIHSLPVGKTDS